MNSNSDERNYNVTSHVREPFYIETDFCKMADTLRAQFEKRMLVSFDTKREITPLTCEFLQDRYQFLAASAERIFTRDILEDLINKLREWADETLGAFHVSTPQARVYVNGCWRGLSRDDISVPWHYVLSLTRKRHRDRVGSIELLTDSIRSDPSGHCSIGRVVSLQPEFNQLLVHDTSYPYGIKAAKTSLNPLDGGVFLDGYLW